MVDSNSNLHPAQQPGANQVPLEPVAPSAAPRAMSPLEAALAMRRNPNPTPQIPEPVNDPTAPPELPPELVVPGVPSRNEAPASPLTKAEPKPKIHHKPRKRRIQHDAVKRPVARKKCFTKESFKRYAVIGSITLAASIIVALALSFFTNGPAVAHKANPFDTNAFFVRERQDAGYYALYGRDGKKYTEFQIARAYEFFDGYALIRNTSGEYGLIADNGRMSVKYDTYDKIVSRGPVYIASKNDKDYRIILGNGKVIAKSDYENTSDLITNTKTPYFIYKERENKYVIYNARGDKMRTIESNERPVIDSASNHDFALITYDSHALIFKGDSYELVGETDFKDGYAVSDYSYDLSLIELKSAESTAFIVSGTFRDDYSACKLIELHNDEKLSRHYATCKQDDGVHLIGKDGTVAISPIPSNRIYYTPTDFAMLENGKITIYVNGESVKTMSDVVGLYDAEGAYYVEHLDPIGNYHYSIFSLKGEQIFTDSLAYGVRGVADENRAVISYGGSYGDHVVMAKKGALSDGYHKIYIANSNLYVGESAGRFTVLNGSGKTITNREYSDAELKDDGSVVAYYDNKIDYYSADGKLRLTGLNARGYAYSSNEYIAQRDDSGKYIYYLLDGRQFAEN